MTPYAAKFIDAEDIQLFEKIRQTVQVLPDIDLGLDTSERPIVLSCHMLARAIGKAFGIKHVDGYFYPTFEHSWLLTSHNNIIDVYPVGILGGPILVDGSRIAPSLYISKHPRVLCGRKHLFSSKYFQRSVRLLIKELKKIN
jgi:hypothetical protein